MILGYEFDLRLTQPAQDEFCRGGDGEIDLLILFFVRVASGVKLINMEEDVKVASIAKVRESKEINEIYEAKVSEKSQEDALTEHTSTESVSQTEASSEEI